MSHAFVPLIISSLVAIVVLVIKQRGDADPEHFLAGSLSAFLPDNAPKWQETLGQSLELFWIWTLALVAIGFSAANPKKIKPGECVFDGVRDLDRMGTVQSRLGDVLKAGRAARRAVKLTK